MGGIVNTERVGAARECVGGHSYKLRVASGCGCGGEGNGHRGRDHEHHWCATFAAFFLKVVHSTTCSEPALAVHPQSHGSGSDLDPVSRSMNPLWI